MRRLYFSELALHCTLARRWRWLLAVGWRLLTRLTARRRLLLLLLIDCLAYLLQRVGQILGGAFKGFQIVAGKGCANRGCLLRHLIIKRLRDLVLVIAQGFFRL